MSNLPRVCVAFQGAALCRVYSRHCFLRYLPANVSQKFPKKLEIVGTSDNRRNTLRFRANGRASSRFYLFYFIASNRPTGRDLFALLAQGYGFWHRISIAHSCINQKKSTRPPLFQFLVHPDHGAAFIDKPGSQPSCTTA
jgi:hypothetical protein